MLSCWLHYSAAGEASAIRLNTRPMDFWTDGQESDKIVMKYTSQVQIPSNQIQSVIHQNEIASDLSLWLGITKPASSWGEEKLK